MQSANNVIIDGIDHLRKGVKEYESTDAFTSSETLSQMQNELNGQAKLLIAVGAHPITVGSVWETGPVTMN